MRRILLLLVPLMVALLPQGAPAAKAASPALDARLCGAMQKDDAQGISALVKRGANPNTACSIAECPVAVCKKPPRPSVGPALGFAVKKDFAGSVKALLEAGANPNAADPVYGLTPLFRFRSAAVADLLFAHGADVAARNKNGDTAVNYLVGRIGGTEYNLNSLSEEQAGALLKLLVAHGADINARDKTGGTVLLTAVTSGYPTFVTALLDAGIDVNAHDTAGHTALGLAKRWEELPLLASVETYQQIEAILRAHGASD